MLGWLIFIIICISLFFVGELILGGNFSKSTIDKLSVFPLVGFVVFTLGIYLFAYLGIRDLVWMLVIAALLALSRVGIDRLLFFRASIFVRKNWLVVLIILAGVVSQTYLIFPNGSVVGKSVNFYGSNAHDGLWHVALIRTLAHTFPPNLPTYFDLPLKNYHYFTDLFASELIRVFPLSAFDLFFKMLPMAFSIHLGLASFSLMRNLTKNRTAQTVAVFLTYFSGSLGFLLVWFRNWENFGETIFWSQQSVSMMNNLPLGVSFSVLITIFILISHMTRKNSPKRLSVVSSILVGSLLGIKAYGGILTIIGFGMLMVLMVYKRKKVFFLLPLLLSLFISAMFYLHSVDNNSKMFRLSPGMMLKLMMESPDRVNLPSWETSRQLFIQAANYFGLILVWSIALLFFLVGNFAHRLLGLLAAHRFFKSDSMLSVFIFSMILIGTLIPLFFTQQGTSWNIIQFLYYPLLLMNLLTAYLFESVKKRYKKLLLGVVIFISAASSFTTLVQSYDLYHSKKNIVSFGKKEIEALEFLEQLPHDKSVLAPYNENAYITAFSAKSVFFADRMQADLLLTDSIESENRQVELTRLFVWCKHDSEVRDFLNQHKIDLIYINKTKYPDCVKKYDNLDFTKKIFDNEEVVIYERNF